MPSLKNFNVKPNGTIILALSGVAALWLLYAINSRQRETVNELRDLRITISKAARQVAEAQNPEVRNEQPADTPSPNVDAEVVSVDDNEDESEDVDVDDDVEEVEVEAPEPDVPTPEAAEGN